MNQFNLDKQAMQKQHEDAAKHYQEASKHHQEAAGYHKSDKHLEGHAAAHKAQGHSSQAQYHA